MCTSTLSNNVYIMSLFVLCDVARRFSLCQTHIVLSILSDFVALPKGGVCVLKGGGGAADGYNHDFLVLM